MGGCCILLAEEEQDRHTCDVRVARLFRTEMVDLGQVGGVTVCGHAVHPRGTAASAYGHADAKKPLDWLTEKSYLMDIEGCDHAH